MTRLTADHLRRLIAIESQVHYAEPPALTCRDPFVTVRRDSPVLFSAPHGALTFRNNEWAIWHLEEEYTAGMALLLSELVGASVIATTWRTDDSDPNYHGVVRSGYKQALRRLIQEQNIRWVIDLHGARKSTPRMQTGQVVDLGTRNEQQSLSDEWLAQLTGLLEAQFGAGTVSLNAFPARVTGRTVTAFSHGALGVQAVQVEMKPSVLVPQRRIDSSLYAKEGPYAAADRVLGMMQVLVDFAGCLQAANG